MTTTIDTRDFFASLAAEMNAHPDRFSILGDADMRVAILMHRPSGDFRVGLLFDGLRCDEVTTISEADVAQADYRLEGDVGDWQAMFTDIETHGRATGKETINSLALMGDRIVLAGDDPMGLDKFSRFNQTLQEFLDGAGHIALPVG
jgi:hypothetical protein